MGLSSRRERCDCPRARVRKENVDVTMFLFHDGIEPVQIFQARHVAHDCRNVFLDGGGSLLQLFLSSPCDHDVGAFVHEALGRGQANSAASAGDDCDLTFQFFHDLLSFDPCCLRFKILRITGPRRGQSCARPPSTATSLAVMKLLSGDARKAATAPISAGSAMRWSGVIEAKTFWPSSPSASLASSVAVAPGDRTFTRMPVPFRSSAQVRARLRTAALLAL